MASSAIRADMNSMMATITRNMVLKFAGTGLVLPESRLAISAESTVSLFRADTELSCAHPSDFCKAHGPVQLANEGSRAGCKPVRAVASV